MTITARDGQAISVGQAQELMADPKTLVVDVRTPAEFESSHIPSSINIPVDQLEPHLRTIVTAAGGTMVLVCQGGGRAEQAAVKLGSAGLSDMVVLGGGMNSWIQAGAPIEHGEVSNKWALERQVRLVAGSIVLTSVLASTLLPKAKWLAGGIGGGLAFAAVSNTCMMGNLLMRLPYNQGPTCDIDAAIAKMRRDQPEELAVS
ncbi:MAG: rhodanese-like domain-containing protein [Nocardioidaceae bacterium]|nr:rhodanese-like domain-containing protein [Nocardioidaceae bacterium]